MNAPTGGLSVDRWEQAGWVVVLLTTALTPLAFTTATHDVFGIVERSVLVAGAVTAGAIALVSWVARRGDRRAPRLGRPPIVAVVVVYLAVLAAATVTSRAPVLSMLGWYGRFGGLVTVVAAVVLAGATVWFAAGRAARRTGLLVAFVASAVAGAGYLLIQQVGWDWHDWPPTTHPPGLLGNSNFSGAHAALGVPAAVALAHRTRRVWLFGGAAAVAAGGVWVSQSRGGMLAAALGATATLALLRHRRLAIVANVAVLGVVAAFVVASVWGGARPERDLLSDETLAVRVDLWEVALRGVPDHPVLGGGPDLYVLTYTDHRDEVASLAGVNADEPHNVALDHLDGAGALGLLAWLAVVAAGAMAARRGQRRDPHVAGFAGIAVAYLGQAMVSIDVVPLVAWGWVALAGLVAAAEPRVREADRFTTTRVRWGGVCAAGVLALAGVAVAAAPLVADHHYDRGQRALADDDRLDHLASAVRWDPIRPEYRLRYAAALAETGRRRDDPRLLDAARDQLAIVEDLAPRLAGVGAVRDLLADTAGPADGPR